MIVKEVIERMQEWNKQQEEAQEQYYQKAKACVKNAIQAFNGLQPMQQRWLLQELCQEKIMESLARYIHLIP